MNRTRTWLWILGSLAAVLLVVLVVVLVTRDDGSNSASSTTTTHASATTIAPAGTSTTAAGTTTRPSGPTTTLAPPGPDDPQGFAQYLYAAWQAGNRADAAKVASADAVNQMFARAYPADGPYTFANCNPAAGSLYCTFNGTGTATILMTVRNITGGLPVQVEGVQFSS